MGVGVWFSTFAGFEQKRYAGPPVVFNVPYCCTEGDASRVGGHVFLVFEGRLFAI